ncbi:MAG: ATP-dependent Clp protease adaptor ClpS [Rhodothermales bacterium]
MWLSSLRNWYLGARPQLVSPASPSRSPEVEVAVDVAEEERLDEPWRVILYNDEIHTFDEVIVQLIKATRCTTSRAEELAWQVHTNGKAVVFEGAFEECFRVQGVLREIQLVTEIEG